MTVPSSAGDRTDPAFMVGAGDGPAYSGAKRRHRRGTGTADGTGCTPVAVPRSGRSSLAALVDHLADRRRSLWRRPFDRVRLAGRLRRHLVARLLARPPGARQRRHPRLADDDVLRRALLHAAAALDRKSTRLNS